MYYYILKYPAVYKVIKTTSTFTSYNIKTMYILVNK